MRKTVTKPRQAASSRSLDRYQLRLEHIGRLIERGYYRQALREVDRLRASMERAESR
ncbi:MAG TPA: hypothetical protein VKA83_09105 [Methylomirabilota bacterium]|nr:hypothetical protein [Methylomirabilota bacterium]